MVREKPVKKASSGADAVDDFTAAQVSVRKERDTRKGATSKSGSSAIVEEKGKAKPKPKPQLKGKGGPKSGDSYLGGIDLPPSDDEEELEEAEEETGAAKAAKAGSSGSRPVSVSASSDAAELDTSITDREAKKRERKEMQQAATALKIKEEALRDDMNAFSVAVASRSSQLEGEQEAVDANSRDVKVENFSVSAKGKELLVNTNLNIVAGKRYGLVGPNGKGKTTLLKLVSTRQIPIPKNIDVLLVEQEVVGEDKSALEAVVAADQELVSLREEEKRLQALTLDDDSKAVDEDAEAAAADRLTAIYERMKEIGAESADARASKILAGLGFDTAMQGRATKSFSGGWRMRISLARALFVQPTLLLLDEPTNHLDLRAVLWLEEYLMRWKKTLVVVSHDRDFLNSVCTDIIHLFDLKLHYYRGNFDAFDDMYEKKRTENNKLFEKYDKQLKAAKASGSKASQDKVKDRAKMAQEKREKKSKGKAATAAGGDEDAPIEAPRKWKDYEVVFHFPEPTLLTPPLMQLIDVSFEYPNRPDFRLSDVNVGVDMGTRVAIIGPNGAGKSTLLNLLAGDLDPTEGEVRRSQKLRIGRYSQHFVDLLTMDENPVQYLLRLYPDQEGPSKSEAMRAKLGKFGLPSHNHLTPIIKLSGGQKARVVFTSISLKQPHILLFDEPTNHLDMQSIDALADALEEFSGGVVLVSHDARLISRVCGDEETSEVWVVEHGKVARYDGSFEEYRKELIKEISKELDE